MSPIRVMVRDDVEVVVQGVRGMLEPFAHRVTVVDADDTDVLGPPVDVTLHDSFTRSPGHQHDVDQFLTDPRCGLVVVYSWDLAEELVREAEELGCAGYLDKSAPAEELLSSVEAIAGGVLVFPHGVADGHPAHLPAGHLDGEHDLSEREQQVVALICTGVTNDEIAGVTYLSINTVKTYIRSAYQKMGVTRRSEAVRWGFEHGMASEG